MLRQCIVAAHLNNSRDTISLGFGDLALCPCCTRMLRVWYYNYESGGWEETAREHLTRQLKEAGYVGAATFLETG